MRSSGSWGGVPRICWVLWLCVGFVAGCDLRQPDDYTIGASLPGKEAGALVAQVVDEFNRRNADRVRVKKMEADEGFELSMLDGFLYERNYLVLHLHAELEMVRDYEIPSVTDLEARIGQPGWGLDQAGRDYELAMLLRRGRRRGRVVYKAGTPWKGKMTALFELVGESKRLKHAGTYKSFRGFSGDGGGQ